MKRPAGEGGAKGEKNGNQRGHDSPSHVPTQADPLDATQPTALEGLPVPERRWLVHEMIPIPHVTGLAGATTTGKSLLAQMLQTAAAIGQPWLGIRTMPARSLGVYCEDDADELWRRQVAINEHFGCRFPDLGDMRWISRFGDDNLLATFDSNGGIVVTDFWHQVVAYAGDLGAGLVVIDTAADTFGGNENVRVQVRQFVSGVLGRIARGLNCAVLLNMHPSRAGMASGEAYSGSTAWEATLRSRLVLERPEAEEGEERDDRRRTLRCTDANYAPPGEPIELAWRRGVFHVVPGETGAFRRIAKSRAENAFLDALDAYTAQGRPLSASVSAGNFAPKAMLGMAETKGLNRQQLRDAMERLFRAKKIAVEQYRSASRGWQRIVRTPGTTCTGCS